MARKIDLPTRVIQAAMDRAAQQGWRQLTMAEIASAARVPLAEMYGRFPSKGAILAEIMHRADAAVLAAGAAPAVEPVRDRLFDVIMRRLDRARRMLTQHISLADAAFACGFADQSHLTRQFRRAYGVTPGRWRALQRQIRA